ncbi:hypothetical protein GCM10027589_52100 [Actinocorallia lasiicapitis]
MRNDKGTMSLELAILTPVLVMLFLLLVIIGRIVDTKSQIDGAARDAARAASVGRTLENARAFAQDAVADGIGKSNWCKAPPQVELLEGESKWQPGGYVVVEVRCVTNLDDLLIPVGNVERVGRATAPLETYRRIDCGGEPCAVDQEGGP